MKISLSLPLLTLILNIGASAADEPKELPTVDAADGEYARSGLEVSALRKRSLNSGLLDKR